MTKPTASSHFDRQHRNALPKAVWVTVGALGYFLQANLATWIFNGFEGQSWIIQVLFFVNCLGLATLAQCCANWVSNFAEESRYSALGWRIGLGAMVFLCGSAIIFALLFFGLFPMLMGRAALNKFHFWSEWSIAGLIAFCCLVLYEATQRQRQHTLQLQLEADRLATALDRAELAMLEAQIEPHFLFNSLAHVKHQYRLDVVAADQMLGALIDYLERATPALRRSDWTVGDELGLIRVYLEILAQRFGERLQFSIDSSEACNALRLPALTVTTLVENAVRHGLAPKADGGWITITASLIDGSLHIDVCDNGVGLRNSSGTGLGLATVRARLQTAFNNTAYLAVNSQQPAGTRASIRVPELPYA